MNTQKGSSGSPCFTADWRLVALHHWGNRADDFNRGVQWSAILEDLTLELRAEILDGSGEL